MASEFDALEGWVEPLMRSLAPVARRRLTRDLARGLRQRQAARVKAQRNPDGSAFAPRKKRAGKTGRIRTSNGMFIKLRQARRLKIASDADGASVGFQGRTAIIARVHQEGGLSRVTSKGPLTRYPERRILGFTEDDRRWVSEKLLAYLSE